MEQRPRGTVSRPIASAVAALGLAALAVLAGCGHHAAAPAASGPPQPSAPAAGAAAPPLKVVYRSVSGRLPWSARQHLAQQMRGVVGRWWADAYLDDRPRASFPVFTPAAARLAEQHAGLMTSALPPGATVRVVRRQIGLDVLAVKKKPVGVDVVADLTYAVGAASARYHVHGTVSMTPTSRGWRVFAFDMTKEKVGHADSTNSGSTKSGSAKSGSAKSGSAKSGSAKGSGR